MPSFPLIDSHVHLFDTERLSYSWLHKRPGINQPHLFADFRKATEGLEVEKLIFAEVWVDPHLNLAEAEWLSQQAAQHPAIAGMIAAAPLENGRQVLKDIEQLKRHPTFRGVRRITEGEVDADFCQKPAFVEAVRLLGGLGLVCDVCVFAHQLPGVLSLARQCPETTIVLDHIGKPAISRGEIDPWRHHIREISRLPNVFCKVSGVLTEADQETWSRSIVRPYLNHALECFGFDRVMFGSDWPVLALTASYHEWVEIVDWTIEGCSTNEKANLYRENTRKVYRI